MAEGLAKQFFGWPRLRSFQCGPFSSFPKSADDVYESYSWVEKRTETKIYTIVMQIGKSYMVCLVAFPPCFSVPFKPDFCLTLFRRTCGTSSKNCPFCPRRRSVEAWAAGRPAFVLSGTGSGALDAWLIG